MAADIMFNSTLSVLINSYISEFSSTIDVLDINDIITDLILVFICFVGILGNSVAVIIISASSSIRKSRPYTLLVNQCLMDIITTIFGELSILAKHTLKREGMEGIGDQLICHTIHNQLGMAIHSCASSYNLAALSVERMFSIVWPIRHRVSFTEKNMKLAALAIWLFSVATILLHSVGTNGIAPNGRCYYWKVHPGSHSKLYSIIFNFVFSIFPFLVMLICYIAMYSRIVIGRLKVKTNVIRVLGTCVLLFFVCHMPRVAIRIISIYGNVNWVTKPIFNVFVAFLIANTAVNPVVYLIQFKDYNREFRRQMQRICRLKSASVVPHTSTLSESTSRSHKEGATNN